MARKEKPHIPQEGSELTPEWFTEVLGEADAQVTAVERTVIGVGIGFLGELYRCALTWEGHTEQPHSVIVKIPAKSEINRGVGEGLGAYEREIVAYRDMSGDLGVTMPKHYYSAMDPDPAPWMMKPVIFLLEKLPLRGVNWLTQQFLKLSSKSPRRYLLVMEDINDARPPQQVEGGSLDDAYQALDVLAGFHATNWMHHVRVQSYDRIWPINQTPKVWQASYLRNRDEFMDRFGELIGPEMVARLEQAQEDLPVIIEPLGTEPWTVLHGDFRLDNLMYRPDGEVVVLDYQLLGYGRPGWDVAYFITTALSPDHREHEEHLLRHYHDALRRAGVTSYGWEQLLADNEATKLLLAHRFVGSLDSIETEMAGQPESFIELLVQRVVGWVR
ncbi:MAG: phosphotransferase [Acidimicrobiia bacterium]|nr:phosphotransferase [Acidimicrobiia bacterium]